MRALVQRVTQARCTVEGHVTGAIEGGLLVLLGAAAADGAADADWLAQKIAGLRIFADAALHMNRDVRDAGGRVLAVPQFTLYGDTRRGRRPDFTAAARPEHAEPLFERFCAALETQGVAVARGVFRAHMAIELVNDGPVTLLIESPRARPGSKVPAAGERGEPLGPHRGP